MDVDQYRKAYEEELAKAKAAVETLNTKPFSAEVEGSAGDATAAAIATLADPQQPAEKRVAALAQVQAATFLGPKFDPYRASYREALRKVATDSFEDLRTQALELLAIDKDDYARELLLIGLNDNAKALVPDAKAVQLLAYDDHSVAVPVARKVVADNYDVATKEEALRVLASDPASDGVLAEYLSDKSQPSELRSISGAGLRYLNPQRFEETARRIVLDETESESVRANCLSALDHMEGYAAQPDTAFGERLEQIGNTSTSLELRNATEKFLQKRKL